jgi:hypothetical protein
MTKRTYKPSVKKRVKPTDSDQKANQKKEKKRLKEEF